LRGGGAHLDMERNSPLPPMFISILSLRPELRRSELAILAWRLGLEVVLFVLDS